MKTIALFTSALFLVFSLNAQEEKKSEIHVKIEKDGKVVKDTTYLVDEDANTEIASKILDMSFGENSHKGEHRVMAFDSGDGEFREFHSKDGDMHAKHKVMMKEMHEGENGHVFVTTEEGEDGEMTVIVKKIKMDGDGEFREFHSKDGDMHAKHKVMMKEMHEGESGNVFITTEEGEDGEMTVIVKKIKIDEDGEHTWTSKDENVFIMKEGEKGELKHIQHNGEKPVWIEEDGAKVMIIDSKNGEKKRIKIIMEDDMDADSDYEFITDDGETIIIKTSKVEGDEKEVKVEVIVEEEKEVKKETRKRKKK